jgi:hypothetical protein
MKKIILMILSVFLFVGCSTSSLRLESDGVLNLSYDSNIYPIGSKVLHKDLLNFKDLYVYQYKLESESGEVVFYEDARTSLNFEFNFGGLYTVLYIFDDAREYEELYQRNNLRMVQIKLKDGSYVNVIIQASDTQEYSYVYGFSNKEFMKIYETLKGKDSENKVLKYEAITFDKKTKNITNWNDKLVYFTPLITPLRIMGRF